MTMSPFAPQSKPDFSRVAPSISMQRGAALIVGLVLLLAITVLGISGMNLSTIELTMAANEQAREAAFQAAEAGVEIPLGTGSFDTSTVTQLPSASLGDGSSVAESEIRCVATTPVPDVAFSAGVPNGGAQAFHFEIVSVGTGPRGATATHKQSFYVVGPAGSVDCAEAAADGEIAR